MQYIFMFSKEHRNNSVTWGKLNTFWNFWPALQCVFCCPEWANIRQLLLWLCCTLWTQTASPITEVCLLCKQGRRFIEDWSVISVILLMNFNVAQTFQAKALLLPTNSSYSQSQRWFKWLDDKLGMYFKLCICNTYYWRQGFWVAISIAYGCSKWLNKADELIHTAQWLMPGSHRQRGCTCFHSDLI